MHSLTGYTLYHTTLLASSLQGADPRAVAFLVAKILPGFAYTYGSGISSQPGTNWLGNSVGTVRVAGTPGYSETTQTDGG